MLSPTSTYFQRLFFNTRCIPSHPSKREDLRVGELSLPPGVNLANDLSTATHPSAVAQDVQSLRSLESGNKETCQYNSH